MLIVLFHPACLSQNREEERSLLGVPSQTRSIVAQFTITRVFFRVTSPRFPVPRSPHRHVHTRACCILRGRRDRVDDDRSFRLDWGWSDDLSTLGAVRVSQQSEARLLLDTLCSHYFQRVAGGSSSCLPKRVEKKNRVAGRFPCSVESGRKRYWKEMCWKWEDLNLFKSPSIILFSCYYCLFKICLFVWWTIRVGKLDSIRT